MNLLTQGKTNWKYVLIVAVLATIVGGGILWYLSITNISPVPIAKAPQPKEPEEGKIVFDVYYRIEEKEEFKGTIAEKWLDIYAVPRVINYKNEEAQTGFSEYALSLDIFVGNLADFFKAEEGLSLKEAEDAVLSLFKSNKTYSFFKCSPHSSFLKKGIASIAFYCDGSGGAHPFYYFSAINYDLDTNKPIQLEDIITLDLKELKSFVQEKKEEAKSCTGYEGSVSDFYFKEEGLVIMLVGHRMNSNCPPSAQFLFSFDEIKDIVGESSLILRLTE